MRKYTETEIRMASPNMGALSQRNIHDAKRYAAKIGWRRPLRGKQYPYASTKRGAKA